MTVQREIAGRDPLRLRQPRQPRQPGTRRSPGSSLVSGRLIGGTTSVNSQMWVQGTTEDFDYWSTELGCESWSFDKVLPFFNSI